MKNNILWILILFLFSCGGVVTSDNPQIEVFGKDTVETSDIEYDTNDIDLKEADECIMFFIDFPCTKLIECISEKQYRKQETKGCVDLGYDPKCCSGAICQVTGTYSCAEDEICVKVEEGTYSKPTSDKCVKKPKECPSGKEGDVLFNFQADGPIVSTPAIGDDGTIYFGTKNGTFYAIDCYGNKKWEWDPPVCKGAYCLTNFETTPTIGEDGIIYTTMNTEDPGGMHDSLVTFTPDGKIGPIAIYSVYSQRLGSPAITDDGTICVGSYFEDIVNTIGLMGTGQLAALNPDGEILNGFPVYTRSITGSPAISNDIIFVGDTGIKPNALGMNNSMLAVNKQGEILWQTDLAFAGDWCYEEVSLSSVAIDNNGRIFAAENHGGCVKGSSLIELEPQTGKKLWEIQVSSESNAVGSPIISPFIIAEKKWGEDVIVALANGHLVSVNPHSGGKIINFDIELKEADWDVGGAGTPVLGDDGYIYAASNVMAAINRFYIFKVSETGQYSPIAFIEDFDNSNGLVSSSLQMGNNGVIYFGTLTGKLFAIQSGADGLDKSTPWPSFRHDEKNTGNAGMTQSLVCGGKSNWECPDSSYFCEYKGCGSDSGTCVKIPKIENCPDYDICPMVCGCNGKSYCDDCERRFASVSKNYDGKCIDECETKSELKPFEIGYPFSSWKIDYFGETKVTFKGFSETDILYNVLKFKEELSSKYMELYYNFPYGYEIPVDMGEKVTLLVKLEWIGENLHQTIIIWDENKNLRFYLYNGDPSIFPSVDDCQGMQICPSVKFLDTKCAPYKDFCGDVVHPPVKFDLNLGECFQEFNYVKLQQGAEKSVYYGEDNCPGNPKFKLLLAKAFKNVTMECLDYPDSWISALIFNDE